jgi:response regulator NasT
MRAALVIDDHEPSRNEISRFLKENQVRVIGEAATAAKGLELATAVTPDIVLMAVGLPDFDGIRATRQIMQARPLPVVLVTSHHDAETVERARRAGVMGYLIKPLRAPELLPAIEVAIGRFQEFVALQKENEDLKKTLEARKVIDRAKAILMKRQSLTEPEAFSLIQRKSMNSRRPMVEIARAIILTEE